MIELASPDVIHLLYPFVFCRESTILFNKARVTHPNEGGGGGGVGNNGLCLPLRGSFVHVPFASFSSLLLVIQMPSLFPGGLD